MYIPVQSEAVFFAEDAKRYLYTELSLALGIPVQEMERYIHSCLPLGG